MNKLTKRMIYLVISWSILTGIIILLYSIVLWFLNSYFHLFSISITSVIAKTIFLPILIVTAIYAIWIIPFIFKKNKKISNIDSSSSSRWMLNETEGNPDKKQIEDFNKIYELNSSKPGFVVRSKISKTGSIDFNSLSQQHAIVIGGTGSGKTQKIIIPSILYNSQLSKEEQPSMVFTDPKGELFSKMSKPLQDSGYEIKVLNLADTNLSDCWNPLATAYKYFVDSEQSNSEEDAEILKSLAYEEINDLTSVLFPKPKSDNPMWSSNAKRMVGGLCQALLEIKQKFSEKLSIEKFNLPAIAMMLARQQEICLWFQTAVPKTNKSFITTSQVVNSAEVTRQGAFSNIAPALEIFEDYGLRNILCNNNIDLFNICSSAKPTALFLIVPDEKDSRHVLASLFVSQLYKASVYTARKSENQTLPRKLLFFLDEFGNMPTIPNFASMVTVGRSRGIFFEIVLQSFNQLIEKYGDNTSKTIRGNCGLNIYIHTNDAKTAKEHSEMYGNITLKKDIVNKSTSGGKTSLSTTSQNEVKPLIDYDKLMKLKDPFGIVSSAKNNPSMVYMEYSWKFKNISYESIEIQEIKKRNWLENYYLDIFQINLLNDSESFDNDNNKKNLALESSEFDEIRNEISILENKDNRTASDNSKLRELRNKLSSVSFSDAPEDEEEDEDE